MRKVSIVGAHGKIARQITQILVGRNYDVDGIIRSESQVDDITSDGASPVLMDIENASADQFQEAFADSDYVIFAAGAGGGNPDRTLAVDQNAAMHVAEAAEKAGVNRFAIISSVGSGQHLDGLDEGMQWYLDAKGKADEYIESCENLPWIIVRPSTLETTPAIGSVHADPDANRMNGPKISRSDVAAVIALAIEKPELEHKAFTLFGGDEPYGAALESLF